MSIGVRLFWGLAAVTATAGAASAEPTLLPKRAIIVSQTRPGEPWRTGPTEARVDDGARLAVVLVAEEQSGRRKRTVYVVDDAIAPLYIGRRKIKPATRRSFSAIPTAAVRWLTVEPHPWREPTERAFYSNVSTDSKDFGKWLGYDPITYFATPISSFDRSAKGRARPAVVAPSRPRTDGIEKLGTIRYQVEVKIGSEVISSPGPSATDRAGILPSVHRVSIRAGDDFLGYLTSFLLVPEVFGSAGSGRNHQTERFTGADCADVLSGAARAAGYRRVKYTSVAGLTRFAKTLAEAIEIDSAGTLAKETKIEPGDIIRINYGGGLAGHTPRSWDHVAVLFEDRSDPEGPSRGKADGLLDGFDRVAHMGHPQLVIEPLASQAPATIDVLRWKSK